MNAIVAQFLHVLHVPLRNFDNFHEEAMWSCSIFDLLQRIAMMRGTHIDMIVNVLAGERHIHRGRQLSLGRTTKESLS